MTLAPLREPAPVAARDGEPTLGLAVTEGNPAIGLYRAHGFVHVLASLTVRPPGR